MPVRPLAQLLAILAVLVGASPAASAGWQESAHSRVRLITAGPVEARELAGRTELSEPLLLAAVEVALDRGWKTYWRTPGDGIAPQFDWSRARNVAATQVLWPVPRFFRDAAGAYNGYKDRVIFPVAIARRNPDEPVALDLTLDYAVCKDVCIPVTMRLNVHLSGGETADREAVMTALRQTPVRADEQGRCRNGLALENVRARFGEARPRLEVSIAHGPDAAPHDLFAEVSTGQFMPHPKRERSAAGRSVFHVDLDYIGDPHALEGETLTLTAANASGSCEMAWTMK